MAQVKRSVILSGFLAGAAVMGGLGCESREESGAAGRNAAVEERPYVNANGPQQRQHTGVIKKVTADWVVIDSGQDEVWVPRDMVLEIRMSKK